MSDERDTIYKPKAAPSDSEDENPGPKRKKIGKKREEVGAKSAKTRKQPKGQPQGGRRAQPKKSKLSSVVPPVLKKKRTETKTKTGPTDTSVMRRKGKAAIPISMAKGGN